MFIHIGNDVVVRTKDIIMILDRYALESKDTSDFLQIAREEGFVVEDDNNNPAEYKSILISEKKIVFSPISSTTLLKRSNFIKEL